LAGIVSVAATPYEEPRYHSKGACHADVRRAKMAVDAVMKNKSVAILDDRETKVTFRHYPAL
jgi:hypothetical protein